MTTLVLVLTQAALAVGASIWTGALRLACLLASVVVLAGLCGALGVQISAWFYAVLCLVITGGLLAEVMVARVRQQRQMRRRFASDDHPSGTPAG